MSSSNTQEYMTRLRQAFLKAVTEDDLREIAQALARQAKKGDLAAAKMLLAYLEPPKPQAPAVFVDARRPTRPAQPAINGRADQVIEHHEE